MTTTTVQQPKATRQASTPSRQSKPKGIAIQAKLTVGQPNDKYEQEADRIADQVIQMPDRSAVQRKCTDCENEEMVQQKPLAASITPWIQRQAVEEREEDIVQTKLLQRQAKEEEEAIQPRLMLQRQVMEEEDPIQTKSLVSENPTPSASLESRLNSSKSGGSPLSDPTRSFMENRIGADFSNVKVHTDSNAVQMSQELGAQAFTHGNHIYFNSGKYSPESTSGKHLLAHEMVHTVQQDQNFLARKTNKDAGLLQKKTKGNQQSILYNRTIVADDFIEEIIYKIFELKDIYHGWMSENMWNYFVYTSYIPTQSDSNVFETFVNEAIEDIAGAIVNLTIREKIKKQWKKILKSVLPTFVATIVSILTDIFEKKQRFTLKQRKVLKKIKDEIEKKVKKETNLFIKRNFLNKIKGFKSRKRNAYIKRSNRMMDNLQLDLQDNLKALKVKCDRLSMKDGFELVRNWMLSYSVSTLKSYEKVEEGWQAARRDMKEKRLSSFSSGKENKLYLYQTMSMLNRMGIKSNVIRGYLQTNRMHTELEKKLTSRKNKTIQIPIYKDEINSKALRWSFNSKAFRVFFNQMFGIFDIPEWVLQTHKIVYGALDIRVYHDETSNVVWEWMFHLVYENGKTLPIRINIFTYNYILSNLTPYNKSKH